MVMIEAVFRTECGRHVGPFEIEMSTKAVECLGSVYIRSGAEMIDHRHYALFVPINPVNIEKALHKNLPPVKG